MSKFDELLNQPLPSAIMGGEGKPMFESFFEETDIDLKFDETDDTEENVDNDGKSGKLNDMKSGSGSSGSDDPDLKKMLEGCSGSGECGECGDVDNCLVTPLKSVTDDRPFDGDGEDLADDSEDVPDVIPPVVDDIEVVKPLTPEQDKNVDRVLDIVGTNELFTNLTDKELKEFAESMDSMILEKEGFITERTIVKFDKYARKAQLFEVAVAACAREHKDPLWRKLQTAYRIRKTILKKLRKRYHNEANRKVKEYLARARKSKSGILSRIAAKITGK